MLKYKIPQIVTLTRGTTHTDTIQHSEPVSPISGDVHTGRLTTQYIQSIIQWSLLDILGPDML